MKYIRKGHQNLQGKFHYRHMLYRYQLPHSELGLPTIGGNNYQYPTPLKDQHKAVGVFKIKH